MSNPVEDLARRMCEAYASRHQPVSKFPALHWDELDDYTRETWRMVAKVAIEFGRTAAR